MFSATFFLLSSVQNSTWKCENVRKLSQSRSPSFFAFSTLSSVIIVCVVIQMLCTKYKLVWVYSLLQMMEYRIKLERDGLFMIERKASASKISFPSLFFCPSLSFFIFTDDNAKTSEKQQNFPIFHSPYFRSLTFAFDCHRLSLFESSSKGFFFDAHLCKWNKRQKLKKNLGRVEKVLFVISLMNFDIASFVFCASLFPWKDEDSTEVFFKCVFHKHFRFSVCWASSR